MRGEQIRNLLTLLVQRGSPPLARGTERAARSARHKKGITPACAGNSRALCADPVLVGDHPRLRGEQVPTSVYIVIIMGSPPLARGTAACHAAHACGAGITPACAGNSLAKASAYFWLQDHPRLRGEQILRRGKCARFVGSPPLARGTDKGDLVFIHKGGITPACAGNRKRICSNRKQCRDHPRLRGEQSAAMAIPAMTLGSPPLARGTAAGG